MLGSGLRKRIAALEHDIAQARRDGQLEPHWKDELAAAREQLRHVNHALPLPRAGVDYSFARPSPDDLRRQGATFVGRYLTGQGKALTGGELRELRSAGLQVIVVFEQEADAMLLGAAEGEAHGRQALAAARELAIPPHRPIFFACDFDIQGDQLPAALAYMRAAKAALDGRYYAGAYGGLTLVRATIGAGFTYAWQTLAWSGGEWEPRAQLRQTAIGAELDRDQAVAADFGQWTP